MKSLLSIACLTLCLLAVVVNAGAQQQLNFSSLPLVNTPSPMPAGYGRLSWSNFFYVDPYDWSAAGPGYQLGAQGQDVAFVGGEFCILTNDTCFGVLTDPLGFELVSANVAAGYGPATITATAYNKGAYVGSKNFLVGTQIEKLDFPSSWGVVTEIQFKVVGQTNDLVVYSLSMYTINDLPPGQ